MRALAQKADVGLMASYKLFGSKSELLAALSQMDVERFQERLSLLPAKDPLDHLFDVLTVAKQVYVEETVFYKGLFRAAYNSQDPSFANVLNGPRLALWRAILEDCVAAGCLDAAINSEAMARNLIYIYSGAIQRWIRDEIDIDRLYAEVHFGFSSALMSFVSQRERVKMRQRFDDAARNLVGS